MNINNIGNIHHLINLDFPDSTMENINNCVDCIMQNKKYTVENNTNLYIWLLEINNDKLKDILSEKNIDTNKFINILINLYSIKKKDYGDDFIWIHINFLILKLIVNNGNNMKILRKMELDKIIDCINIGSVYLEDITKLFSRYSLFNGFKYFYENCYNTLIELQLNKVKECIIENASFNSDLRVFKYMLNFEPELLFFYKERIFMNLFIAHHIDFKYKVKRIRLLNEKIDLKKMDIHFLLNDLCNKLNIKQLIKVFSIILDDRICFTYNDFINILSLLEQSNLNHEIYNDVRCFFELDNLNIHNKIYMSLVLLEHFTNPDINFNEFIDLDNLENIENILTSVLRMNLLQFFNNYKSIIIFIYQEKRNYIYKEHMKNHYDYLIKLIKIFKIAALETPNNLLTLPFIINNETNKIHRVINEYIRKRKYVSRLKNKLNYDLMLIELNKKSWYYKNLSKQSFYKNIVRNINELTNYNNIYLRYNIEGKRYNGYFKPLDNNCKVIYNYEKNIYQIYDIDYNLLLKDRYEFILEKYNNKDNIIVYPLIRINKKMINNIRDNNEYKGYSIIDVNNNIEYII